MPTFLFYICLNVKNSVLFCLLRKRLLMQAFFMDVKKNT